MIVIEKRSEKDHWRRRRSKDRTRIAEEEVEEIVIKKEVIEENT